MSKPYSAYGKVIVVHPGGLETVYSHNLRIYKKSGDAVPPSPLHLPDGLAGYHRDIFILKPASMGSTFNPNLIFNINEGTLRKACLQCIKKGNKSPCEIAVITLDKLNADWFAEFDVFVGICKQTGIYVASYI